MLIKKHAAKECVLCGSSIPFAEAAAIKYPCLSTCLRLIDSSHLREHHDEYLKLVERRAPIYFYAFSASTLLTLFSLLFLDVLSALPLALLAAISLTLGTIERRRLIRRFRCV